MYESVDILQVRNSSLVVFSQPIHEYRLNQRKNTDLIKNLKSKKTYSGIVTVGSAKKIRKAVDILLQMSPPRVVFNEVLKKSVIHTVGFITLTIPAKNNITDNRIAYKQLLKPFLRTLQDKKLITSYIWKAELQKRGQLHYHVTCREWINYQIIKDTWNNLLRKHSYMDEYIKKYGHANPNSTDIHKVYKIQNVESYLCKYLSKRSSSETSIKGKVWGCSENIRGAKYYTTAFSPSHEINLLKKEKKEKIIAITNEKCTIIKATNNITEKILTNTEFNQYKKHMDNIKNNIKTDVKALIEFWRNEERMRIKLDEDLALLKKNKNVSEIKNVKTSPRLPSLFDNISVVRCGSNWLPFI